MWIWQFRDDCGVLNMIQVAGYDSMHNDVLGNWQYIIQHALTTSSKTMALASQTRHVPRSNSLARCVFISIAGQLQVYMMLSTSAPLSQQACLRLVNSLAVGADSTTGWPCYQKLRIFSCPVAMVSTCPHQQSAKQRSIRTQCNEQANCVMISMTI
jgi:hypothetical protein